MSRILVALRGVHFSDWLWISAVGVGVVLRVFALGGQIPVNDEWHAIHAMQELKPAFLLTRYGASDYSIPLTAYFLAVGHTFGLSEFSMRLPLLVAGIATLILLPSMVRPIVGRRAAAIFAWLLALSPILIFFSRMARPYAIVSLFAVWGLVAFQRTWEQGKLRSAVHYALCVTVCGLFLVVSLPFVLAPFPYYGIRILLRADERRWRSFCRLITLGLGSVAPLLCLLSVPLLRSSDFLVNKLGAGELRLITWMNASQVILGAAGSWVSLVLAALAVFGLAHLIRRRFNFATLALFACLLQIAAILVSRPLGIDGFFVLARYLLPVALIVLLLAAYGIFKIVPTLGLSRRRADVLVAAVASVVCLVVFFSGPLPKVLYAPNNWMTAVFHSFWLGGKWQRYARGLEPLPEFYGFLSRQQRNSLLVVESPWNLVSPSNHLPVYQRIHGQRTMIGFTVGLCSEAMPGEVAPDVPWLRMRNLVHLADFSEVRARGADFVVFHKDFAKESKRRQDWVKARDMSGCIEAYREEFGEPFFEDGNIVVFATKDGEAARGSSSMEPTS